LSKKVDWELALNPPTVELNCHIAPSFPSSKTDQPLDKKAPEKL
jgi:hypothetical protein